MTSSYECNQYIICLDYSFQPTGSLGERTCRARNNQLQQPRRALAPTTSRSVTEEEEDLQQQHHRRPSSVDHSHHRVFLSRLVT